ncbi:RNA polymerase recycling motor HelD [Pontibacillus marinus]|uniref:Helicase n=1 Tax=Pontibacillus marinus BH030004 = DSM 16465 TaxID=1385511 RepID=A0A0A5GHT1_9BACI|nr:RNA polymerase recycling motor HelD [Pontibacillus marinus]KGX90670.1 helicase [Pontibacillus marinus BH030004 = DSM 16465]
MTEKHEDWQLEQQRINNVLDEIEHKKEKLREKVGDVKGEVIGLRENFWEDVTVNLDEHDDVVETVNSLKQQAELLGERERSHKHFYDQLKTLQRMQKNPYFGRVDFREGGDKEAEEIYIGVGSLMDQNDEDFLIYDWRAPISSLYYDYSPGPAEYETPEGTIEGEMELKRQFIIRDGDLKGLFDTGVTIMDELLQEVLGNNANTQMKSIVATIQKEQNQIIRYDQSKYVVVQGVAGSGKTSAALQRVAYLLYRYRGKIDADQMMLFSPNPMFNSYVANVLPELGEENMEQTTFQEYMDKRLESRIEFEDAYTQLEYLLTAKQDDYYKTRLQGIRFKANLAYKDVIDSYVQDLELEGMIFRNVKFRGKTIVSSHEIHEYFYGLEDYITIPNRIEMVAAWILKRLEAFSRKERDEDWVEEEIEMLSKEDYLKIYHKVQEGRENEDRFDDYIREQAILAKAIVNKYMKPIKRKIKDFQFINMTAIYRNLFTRDQDVAHESWKAIAEQTNEQLQTNLLFHEDVTPFLYLEDQLKGIHSYNKTRYLFLDEAQDYSPFQLEFFKQLFPNARMTILGDYNQAIYAHNLNAPTPLSEELYQDEKMEKMTLLRSYRSTRPIIEFTKGIVPGGEDIEPFNREGDAPTVTVAEDWAEHTDAVVGKIHDMEEESYDTVAVICKTAKEAREAYERLKHDVDIRLMDKDTYTFEKGLILIPAYLAKGIEFDAVILYNASDEEYHQEIERNLFYTACTRPMHELHLFSLGKVTRFIE